VAKESGNNFFTLSGTLLAFLTFCEKYDNVDPQNKCSLF